MMRSDQACNPLLDGISWLRDILRQGTVAMLSLAMLVGGCTTQKAIDMSPDALRTALRNSAVAPVGEQIVIVTVDGKEHAVEFVEVDVAADTVRGKADDGEVLVPIGDIVVIRSRRNAPRKTALLAVAVMSAIAIGLAVGEAGEDLVEIFIPK